jgi:hypothetical protein
MTDTHPQSQFGGTGDEKIEAYPVPTTEIFGNTGYNRQRDHRCWRPEPVSTNCGKQTWTSPTLGRTPRIPPRTGLKKRREDGPWRACQNRSSLAANWFVTMHICTELESRECHYYHGIDYAGSSYRWEVKWDCLSWRSARKVQLKFVRKCLSRIETRVPHVPKLRTPGSFAGTLRGKLQRACLARNRRCLAMARRQTTPDRQAYSCALPRQREASRLFMAEIVLAKRVRRA